MKRPRNLENCIYAPLTHASSANFGVIQVANYDREEGFSQEDARLLRIIAQNVAQFLHH
jgi:hypothetical protein